MASQGGSAPSKPWERASTPGPSPFRPSSEVNNTAAGVGSEGVADSGGNDNKSSVLPPSSTISGRQMPPRPWERNNYGGNNSTTNYSLYTGLGTSSYGMTPYGGSYGGPYGSSLGNNYRGYGLGGTYSGGFYGGGSGLGNMSSGGMYSSPYGGGMYNGGYGIGMGGPSSIPYEPEDPNNPFGGQQSPAGPPRFWQSMLHTMHGVMTFFGGLFILIDQNTQAFHIFITALLQLCDRGGMLYGELAQFVLQLLFFRSKPRFQPKAPASLLLNEEKSANYFIEGSKDSRGAWNNLWSEDVKKAG